MRSNFLLAARVRRGPEAHLPTEEPDNPRRPPSPPVVPDVEPPPVPAGDPPPEAPPERLR